MFLLNGQAQESLPLTDRGLHYGDGLFETIVWRGGRLEFWSRHMARLGRGCLRLGLVMPETALLEAEARQLCREQAEGIVKIIITRGSGGRGYRAPEGGEGSRILGFYPLPAHPPTWQEQGVALTLCRTPLATGSALAGLKHLNRLEQVLARGEWLDEYQEGLMCDPDGHVIEGTMSNLFFVREGELFTPDLSNCGVSGIIREVVIDQLKQEDKPVRVGTYPVAELKLADELFVTNSVIGLWPVSHFMGERYRPGPVTKKIKGLLNQRRGMED